MFLDIFKEFNGRDFARAHLLRTLAGQLVSKVVRLIHTTLPQSEQATDLTLLRRFEQLLEAGYLAHWPVTEYARRLAVSPTHLSRVLRSATGQSASQLIDSRLLREARRQLIYTNLPISQIAYELGFIDPAYFSRFFTRGNGASPRVFRTRHENG